MLFCSVETGKHIERCEQEILVETHAVIKNRLPDCITRPISGGFALYAEPGAPFNKIAGLGFEKFDEEAWADLEAAHEARQADVRVELSTLADPELGKWLTKRGYNLIGVENILGLALDANKAVPPVSRLRIEKSAFSDIKNWVQLSATGFAAADDQGVASPDSFDLDILQRIMAEFVQINGISRYLATIDETPAGTGALYIRDGFAILCGASTLPAYRRRGVQSALLAHRIAVAAASNCSMIVVTTSPGSKSQENVQRQDFSLLYSRLILQRGWVV
jgi:GNAT superfamily N-acetyltransferase